MLVLLYNRLQAVALCSHFMDLELYKPLNHLQKFLLFFYSLPLQTLNFFYFLNLFDLMADIKNMG